MPEEWYSSGFLFIFIQLFISFFFIIHSSSFVVQFTSYFPHLYSLSSTHATSSTFYGGLRALTMFDFIPWSNFLLSSPLDPFILEKVEGCIFTINYRRWDRLAYLVLYGGSLSSLRNVLLKMIGSSWAIGLILGLWCSLYGIVLFDERISWRVYLSLGWKKGKSKPFSVNCKFWFLFLAAIVLLVFSYSIGYCLSVRSKLESWEFLW